MYIRIQAGTSSRAFFESSSAYFSIRQHTSAYVSIRQQAGTSSRAFFESSSSSSSSPPSGISKPISTTICVDGVAGCEERCSSYASIREHT